MDVGLGHFIGRFFEPFNSESRFYWPLVLALAVAVVANIVWYYTRRRSNVAPGEIAARPWAVWANLITLIWVLLLVIAKVPFLAIALSFAVDLAILAYLYAFWLPPREVAWLREMQRQKYIPQPERKRRKKR